MILASIQMFYFVFFVDQNFMRMSNKLFYIHGKFVNNYNGACNIFILVRRRICSKKKEEYGEL